MVNQAVIPVIHDWKQFERFLGSELTWCIVMDFHINFIEDIIKQAHQAKKRVIVHMDLIHGLSNDPYGAQFLSQKHRVDGIISTKAKVIESAKTNHCLAILRLFMIDSKSISKGCAMANALQPDYLEVLPAMTMRAVERIRAFTDLEIIGGGLIQSVEDIKQCLTSGMCAISTSDLVLCQTYSKQK